MLVSSISIRGLKSIESLDIDLDPGVTPIYGPNGIGKSTSLEALSLLGHLHYLPIVTLANGGFHAMTEDISALPLLPKLRASGTHWKSLQEWFLAPKRGGAIEFNLRHPSIDGNKQINIYVFVGLTPEAAMQGTEPSLTSLLSSAFPDTALRQSLCIVVDPSTEHHARSLAELTSQSIQRPRGRGAVVVSYINTDLNDFGRGNDLRESPKDLAKDFAKEVEGRLQVPFDGPEGSLARLAELNAILKKVLKYPALYVPGMSAENTSFEIAQCAIDKDTRHLTFTVKRLADNRDYSSIDFLSAGENECFFVFCLLLHLPLSGGLLLLDEPDLHLGPHQKREFFGILYEQVKAAGCQCVIVTHSEYALAGFNEVNYAVIRPVVEKHGKDYIFRYVADSDVDLRLAHSKLLLARAAQSLRFTGLFGKRTFAILLQNFSNLRDQVFFFVNLGVIMFLVLLLAVSAYSDILRVVFGQTNAAHDKVAEKIVWSLVGAFGTLFAFLGWSYMKRTTERRAQRALLKKALKAKAARTTK